MTHIVKRLTRLHRLFAAHRYAFLAGLALTALPSAHAVGDPVVLLKDPSIQAALEATKRNEPDTLEAQIQINEIPAPPFKEHARAADLKRRFTELGLKNVFIDKEGNVLGTRPGAQPRPHLVIAAHLDTVFPEGTDVTVKREGAILKAPGIGDDTRGLAAMLSVIRALDEGKVRTPGTITFVANVGEEGLGDLRGAKALFNDTLKDQVDFFISIDGTSINRIVYSGIGSYRYRVTFKGPGGHSYGAFGLVNPIHALGRAIAKIDALQVPASPKVTFNVGRVGGGTSVNSIPFEGWMEIDMRSVDVPALDSIRDQILAAIDAAVKEENERWKHNGEITVVKDLVGLRPAGQTPPDSAIVGTAQAAIAALGPKPALTSGSTDSNIPISLGIPAITLGGGGLGKDAHALTESFDSTNSWQGPQAVLLTAVALVQ